MNTDMHNRIKAGKRVGNRVDAPFCVLRALRNIFGALALIASLSTTAQDFPARPVRLVVPVGAGSTTEILARVLAPEMSKSLGRPVVVENKPGAVQMIGIEYVLGQPADGYVIAFISLDVLASLPATVKVIRFDPLKDLPPFKGVVEGRWVLGSSAQLPWKSFGEFVDSVKGNPGKFNWGSTAAITSLLTEVILRDKGLVAQHVPFSSGGGTYNQSLLSGAEIQFALTAEIFAAQSGDRFRTFALTGRQRSPTFPGVPTFAELGFPQIPSILYSLNARAGTPSPVLERLGGAASRALQQPEIKAQYAKLSFEIAEQGPEAAMQALVEREKLYSGAAKQMGLKPE